MQPTERGSGWLFARFRVWQGVFPPAGLVWRQSAELLAQHFGELADQPFAGVSGCQILLQFRRAREQLSAPAFQPQRGAAERHSFIEVVPSASQQREVDLAIGQPH